MKLKNTLIVVKDIVKAAQFYHDLFGLEMIRDNDGNMILTDGLVLQEEKYWKVFLKRDVIPQSNSCELYTGNLVSRHSVCQSSDDSQLGTAGHPLLRLGRQSDRSRDTYAIMKYIANIITGSRIVFSIALLFFPPLSSAFYVLYAAAGLTDMIDGTVARKTNTVSSFGAKLDTIADYIFAVVCLIKLMPVLDIPAWLWIWIGGIALIKIINIISGVVLHKKLTAVHSVMNKVTGALCFLLPLTLSFIELKYSAIVVCSIATFAAIQEGHFIRMERTR